MKNCLLVFFGHWLTNLEGFSANIRARLYRVFCTCPNEKSLCPILRRKLSFSKVIVFNYRLSDSEQNLNSFFHKFLAGLSELHSKCPQEVLGRKGCMKKIFILKYFLEFEHKVLGLFPKHFCSPFQKAFEVSTGTVCGKLMFKKNAIKLKFTRTFFEKSRTFGGKYPAMFQNIFLAVDSNLVAKTVFSIEKVFADFFGQWATFF